MPHRYAVRLRIFAGDEIALGPGKARLLENIQRLGSISAAAREMEMSYGRAWQLAQTMNALFRKPLVASEAGGRSGGGARLTPLGREILAAYRKAEASAQAGAARAAREIQKEMKDAARDD